MHRGSLPRPLLSTPELVRSSSRVAGEVSVASPAAACSANGSHTSGGSRCSHKTRSKSLSCSSVPPSDNAHRSLADTPNVPCFPTCPPQIASWLGYILNGTTLHPSVTF